MMARMRALRRPAGFALVAATLVAVGAAACRKESGGGAAPGERAEATVATRKRDVDVDAFCRNVMSGRHPQQCYARDGSVKVPVCVDTLRSGLRKGRITIDAEALAACETAVLAKIETLDHQRNLGHLAQRFEACRRVATGRQGEGEECLGRPAARAAPGRAAGPRRGAWSSAPCGTAA